MDFNKYMDIWGNGNRLAGLSLFDAVTKRLEYARKKHPEFAGHKIKAVGVIKDELDELEKATLFETEAREFDEALDVIATALRFSGREYKE